MNILGKWEGSYKYSHAQIQKIIGFDKTNFTIVVDSCEGGNFSGIVNDDALTGGMTGIGKITGKVIGTEISFQKQMPHNSIILNSNGDRKRTEQKHPILYYTGTITTDMTSMSGTWKFKRKFGFVFGFIPFYYRPAKGTWKMKLNFI
jgi:hypothetical protein